MSLTSNTTSMSKFDNTSRENYNAWRIEINEKLTGHRNALITIVNDEALTSSIRMRIRGQCATLRLDATETAQIMKDHHKEFNTEAYYIVLNSVAHKTTRDVLKREHHHDGHKAYKYINDMWSKVSTRQRAMARDADRAEIIRVGARSGSLEHMTTFVEDLLRINVELKGTSYEFPGDVLTNHMLGALRRHDPAYVRGFVGSYSGYEEQFDDFNHIRSEVKGSLEASDLDKKRDTAADVLHTSAAPSTLQSENDCLREELAEMKKMILAMSQAMGTTVLKTASTRDSWPLCSDCNTKHPQGKIVKCVGKALVEGTITEAEALKSLSAKNTNPKRSLENAMRRYREFKGIPPSPAVPAKTHGTGVNLSYAFMTKEAPPSNTQPSGWQTMHVDTCADISIFNDIKYFTDGYDSS